MSETEQMSINERRKYLHKMRIRYWQVKTKKERNALLDEMQAVTRLHRKSLIRLIKGELARKPRRQQRGKTYGSQETKFNLREAYINRSPFSQTSHKGG